MKIATQLRAYALAVVPFTLIACVSGDRAVEPIDEGEDAAAVQVAADAEAVDEHAEEALDPNDPNVLVCPVTGAMQRIDDDEAAGYHSGDEDEY